MGGTWKDFQKKKKSKFKIETSCKKKILDDGEINDDKKKTKMESIFWILVQILFEISFHKPNTYWWEEGESIAKKEKEKLEHFFFTMVLFER